MEQKTPRIRELDGLRAIAIVLVLGCHYEGFSQLAGRIPELGWIGVDLFFCLSGYLITSILLGLRGKATPYRTFYSRRLIRILPPYLAVIAVVAIFILGHREPLTGRWLSTQLLFLQAFDIHQIRATLNVLIHPRWYVEHLPALMRDAGQLPREQVGAPLTIVIVPFIFWSLSIEEYFYLLWAPVVLRLSRTAIVVLGITVCVLEAMLRWILATPNAYFGIGFRFDALLYGALLALLFERWSRSTPPRWSRPFFTGVLGGVTIGVAAMLYAVHPVLGRDPRASPLFLAFGLPLLSLGFSALIGLLILRSDQNWWFGKTLRTRPFQLVGTISYTMYLVHLVAASIIRYASGQRDPFRQTLLQAVLATALTVALAQASWVLLEKRLLRWKDTHFPTTTLPQVRSKV